MMVSIKEATGNAIAFAQESLGPERTFGVRLEEVDSTKVDGMDAWLITLSMPSTIPMLKRDYKSFTVLKHNGEVTSMKIRELADA